MDDEAAGVPDWVVTYGDMMSLLLTFFIMLVSLSEVAGEEKYRAILNSLQKYVGYRTTPLAPPGKTFPLNSMIAKLETLGSFVDNEKGHGGVKREAPEGAHIRVLRKREGSPFQVGKSIRFAPRDETLSEEAKLQLVAIAKQLAGKPNKIDIRAHTSSDGSAFKKNVDLSYRRARNVRGFLVSQEIAPNRMRATAITDAKPLPASADGGASQFDRVDVLILDLVVDQ
jgi:chemotaxis protein MotB